MKDLSRSSKRTIIAPWLLWVTGLFVAFYPAILSGFAELQITAGDPRLVNYILEHTYLWLTGDPMHKAFWSPPVFYPALNVGTYSDTMLGAAPFYWLWRILGCQPGLSLQLWMMTCLSLCFFFIYIFLSRCLCFGSWQSSLGAFLFAFGITRLANFNSPQLFPIFYSVIALISLNKLFASMNDKEKLSNQINFWIMLFFATIILQIWSAFYPSFFFIFILCITAFSSLLFIESRSLLFKLISKHYLALSIGVMLTILAVLPLAQAHLKASKELGFRTYSEVEAGLPVFQSWFFPGNNNFLYGGLSKLDLFSFKTPPSQHSNGLGFLTIILSLTGLILERRRLLVRITLVTLSITIVLFTGLPGPNGRIDLWRVVYDFLPVAKAIRYPARVGMFLPLVSALGLAYLFSSFKQGRWRWFAALLALVCMIEQFHVIRVRNDAEYNAAIEQIAEKINSDCKAFILVSEGADMQHMRRSHPSPNRLTHIAAMWVSNKTGVPTINGFYGNYPRGWTLYQADLLNKKTEKLAHKAINKWIAKNKMDAATICKITVSAEELPW